MNKPMQRDTDYFDFQLTERESLYSGFYQMDCLHLSHQRFDGGYLHIKRELMNRHDAVCVLLVDLTENQVVLVEQFRVGAINEPNPWLLELVAGLIDKNETPEIVAHREAQEEAGVSIKRLQLLNQYLPSPGGSNEKVHLYVAQVDSRQASGVHGLAAEQEDIRVHCLALDQAYQYCTDGTICNAATLIALQWLQLNEATLRQSWADE